MTFVSYYPFKATSHDSFDMKAGVVVQQQLACLQFTAPCEFPEHQVLLAFRVVFLIHSAHFSNFQALDIHCEKENKLEAMDRSDS